MTLFASRSWISRLFSEFAPTPSTSRRPPLAIEDLESRWVPSTTSGIDYRLLPAIPTASLSVVQQTAPSSKHVIILRSGIPAYFLDASGHLVGVKFTGPGNGSFTLTNGKRSGANIDTLTLSNTTGATSLIIRTQGGVKHLTSIKNLVITPKANQIQGLKLLDAPSVDLATGGTIQINGSVAALQLHTVGSHATINITGNVGAISAFALSSNSSLLAPKLNALTVANGINTSYVHVGVGGLGNLSALAIQNSIISTTGHIGNVKVAGDILNSELSSDVVSGLDGLLGTLDDHVEDAQADGGINSLMVGRSLKNSIISAVGPIGSVNVGTKTAKGSMSNSMLLANVNPGPNGHYGDLDDIATDSALTDDITALTIFGSATGNTVAANGSVLGATDNGAALFLVSSNTVIEGVGQTIPLNVVLDPAVFKGFTASQVYISVYGFLNKPGEIEHTPNTFFLTPSGFESTQVLPAASASTPDQITVPSYSLDQFGIQTAPNTWTVTLPVSDTLNLAFSGRILLSAGAPVQAHIANDLTVSAPSTANPTDASTGVFTDFLEFTVNPPQAGKLPELYIDTSQVDWFGFPMTLQVAGKAGPGDVTLGPVGVVASRDIVNSLGLAGNNLNNFQSFIQAKTQTNPRANAFEESYSYAASGVDGGVILSTKTGSPILVKTNNVSGLAEGDVIVISGVVDNADANGTWKVKNITKDIPPINQGIYPGSFTLEKLDGTDSTGTHDSAAGGTWVLQGSIPLRLVAPKDVTAGLVDNPLHTRAQVIDPLNTYFDQSIDQLFLQYYTGTITGPAGTFQGGGKTMEITNNFGTFQGKVTTVGNNYVFEFTSTSTNKSYDVYYPFFSTNLPTPQDDASNKTGSNGKYIPIFTPAAAPKFLEPSQYESPSEMIFACDGAFADGAARPSDSHDPDKANIIGDLENQLSAALNRGVALDGNPAGNTIKVTNYWQDSKDKWYSQTTGQKGVYNYWAEFFHQQAVVAANESTYPLAYAFAFDDQGKASSTLHGLDVTAANITLGSWSSTATRATTTSLSNLTLTSGTPGVGPFTLSVKAKIDNVDGLIGTPTGNVTFFIDGVPLSATSGGEVPFPAPRPVTLQPDGTATLTGTLPALPVGGVTHSFTLTAVYSGDGTHLPSIGIDNVTRPASKGNDAKTTALNLYSSTEGQSVTVKVTATVPSGSAISPVGTVEFDLLDGNNTKIAVLAQNIAVAEYTATATFDPTKITFIDGRSPSSGALPEGAYTIKSIFSGDNSFSTAPFVVKPTLIAKKLVFATEPSGSVNAGETFDVVVNLVNDHGTILNIYDGTVKLTAGNDTTPSFTSTASIFKGQAIFHVKFSQPGMGFALKASYTPPSTPPLSQVSNTFNVIAMGTLGSALTDSISGGAATASVTLSSGVTPPIKKSFFVQIGNTYSFVNPLDDVSSQPWTFLFKVGTPTTHAAGTPVILASGVAGLQTDLSSSDTTVNLNAGYNAVTQGFPTTGHEPFFILIDQEVMKVVQQDEGNSKFTVLRGQNGTTAMSHTAQSVIYLQT